MNHWQARALPVLALALLSVGAVASSAFAATPTGEPTGLVATAVTPFEVRLNWTAPVPGGGDEITGYEIERANGSLGSGPFLNSTDRLYFSYGNRTTFTDSGLAPGTTYNYSVFALLSSPRSGPASASTPLDPPGAPTGLTAKPTTFSRMALGWNPPPSNGGSPVTGYEVERAQGDLSFGTFSNSTGIDFLSTGNATSFTDSGLQPSTTYNYTVFAENRAGSGPPSVPSNGTTLEELSVTVQSDNLTGSAVGGMPVELENYRGAAINSGHTPVTFHVSYGERYAVVAGNLGTNGFEHWDDGTTNATRTITPNANMTITAYYGPANLPPFSIASFLKTGSPSYQQDSQMLIGDMEGGDYIIIHGNETQFPTTLQEARNASLLVRPGVNVVPAAMYTRIADITSQVPAWPKGLGLVFYDYENGTGFSPEFTSNETKSIGYFDEAENAVRQYNANTGGNARLMVAPSYSELRAANWDWGLAAKHMDMIDVQFGGYTESPNLFKYAPQVYSQIRQESPGTQEFIELSLMPNRGTPQITSSDIYQLDADAVGGFLPWYDQASTAQSATLMQFLDLLPRSAPPPPANLTVSGPAPSQASLTWSAPSGNVLDISGYKVERVREGDTAWSVLSWDTASNATSFSDSGLAPASTYTYRVSAINTMGTGPSSGNATYTTPGAAAAPGAPTGLAAKATTFSRIKLGWSPPADNGGSPITGYEIERAMGDLSFGAFSNSTGALFFSFGNATSFVDSGLAPNTTYNYTVFAENKAGSGPPSAPASATTPPEVSITVVSRNSTGAEITGIPVRLESSAGTVINSGHTTATFHVTEGGRYNVVAENYGNYSFSHWDDGTTNATRPVAAAASMTLTAFYN